MLVTELFQGIGLLTSISDTAALAGPMYCQYLRLMAERGSPGKHLHKDGRARARRGAGAECQTNKATLLIVWALTPLCLCLCAINHVPGLSS